MENLEIHFDLNGDGVHDEMRIAAPYTHLVWFISSAIGHSISTSRWYLKHLSDALAGTPIDDLDGNLLSLAADETTATLTNLYDAEDVNIVPTAILYEAIERWMEFLETHGRDATVKRSGGDEHS